MRNRRVVFPLCCYSPSPHIVSFSPEQYHANAIPDNFLSPTFPNITQYCRCYHDDAVSQLNDDHSVGGRIWPVQTAQVRCDGLLSKLQIPKLKKRTTQGPVPRSLSFYKGPWVILWDCEVDDVNFPQSESPVEDVGFPRGSFPDCHASGEQDSELDQDVATPTNCTAWSSDEELTPLFSSNFPRTPHSNTLRGEVHPDGELLGISAPSPIRSDTL